MALSTAYRSRAFEAICASLQRMQAVLEDSRQGVALRTATLPIWIPLPHIASPSSDDFSKQLTTLSIAPSAAIRLCSIYVHSCSKLRSQACDLMNDARRRLCATGSDESEIREVVAKLDAAAIYRYTEACEECLGGIRDLVCSARARFEVDAETAAEQSSSEEEDGRGHPSSALGILEAAYSHTTNITQAEKHRLATATGLQPRQVTIWFQNRRNRKYRTPKATGVTYQSKQVVHLPLKRKTPPLAEFGPSYPSTPFNKRARSSSPNTGDNTRVVSASSTSSSSSFDTLESWSHFGGRVGKSRFFGSGSTDVTVDTPHKNQSSSGSEISDLDSHQLRHGNAQELLFSEGAEGGVPMLDFDDLQLDPATLQDSFATLDPSVRTAPVLAPQRQRDLDSRGQTTTQLSIYVTNATPRQESFPSVLQPSPQRSPAGLAGCSFAQSDPDVEILREIFSSAEKSGIQLEGLIKDDSGSPYMCIPFSDISPNSSTSVLISYSPSASFGDSSSDTSGARTPLSFLEQCRDFSFDFDIARLGLHQSWEEAAQSSSTSTEGCTNAEEGFSMECDNSPWWPTSDAAKVHSNPESMEVFAVPPLAV